MPIDNRKLKKVNIEELDLTPPVIPESAPEPEPTLEPEVTLEPELEPVLESEPTPEPEVDVEPEPTPEPEPIKEDVDYKEKFSESSREAMSLHFKNEKLNSLLSGELEVPEPTEEELRAYAKANDSDYDELDNFTKSILRDTVYTKKKDELRSKAYKELREIDTWAKRVDEFVSSEENITRFPSLEGQEETFKRYCMKDTQRGVDFNLLVASFLYENDRIPEKKNKGSLFLSRGNGRTVPSVPIGISAGEAERIRINDPKRYRQLIKAGKIKIEI